MRSELSASTESTTAAAIDPLPAAYLRRIWERMAAVYGGKWSGVMGDSPNNDDGALSVFGDTWARGLAGLSTADLARGLEACLASPSAWPPTLPEFKSKALGIPSFSEVTLDLVRNKHAQRQPFTVAVFQRVDAWSYRQAPELTAEKMLLRAYADQCEATMRGEPLPEPLPELERKPHTLADNKPKAPDPAVAAAALSECRALLREAGATPPEGEYAAQVQLDAEGEP